MISGNGGKNSSSVSGRTSYLLAGEKPGPEKIRKAGSLGIEIIGEDRFREMISEKGGQAGNTDGNPSDDNAVQLSLF